MATARRKKFLKIAAGIAAAWTILERFLNWIGYVQTVSDLASGAGPAMNRLTAFLLWPWAASIVVGSFVLIWVIADSLKEASALRESRQVKRAKQRAHHKFTWWPPMPTVTASTATFAVVICCTFLLNLGAWNRLAMLAFPVLDAELMAASVHPIQAGYPIWVNTYLSNGNPGTVGTNVRYRSIASPQAGPPTVASQQAAESELDGARWYKSRDMLPSPPSSLGSVYFTVFTRPVTGPEIEAIKIGAMTLYAIAQVQWTDQNGTNDEIHCVSLVPPAMNPQLPQHEHPWANCPIVRKPTPKTGG